MGAPAFSDVVGLADSIFDNVFQGVKLKEQKRQFGKEFGLEKDKFGLQEEEFDLAKAATLTQQVKGFKDTQWRRDFRRAFQ